MFRHVLLEDKEEQALKAEIFKDDTLKRCEVCGKAFSSTSNNAKYCEGCAKTESGQLHTVAQLPV